MRTFERSARTASKRLSLAAWLASLALLCAHNSNAFPLGRINFHTDAPFVGASGVQSIIATDMQSLLTVSGWSDTNATVPANLYQWWWILGVDSGTGNGALIDGNEALTLHFDKSVGAGMIYFFYTGGSGGANNLARLSVSGFASDPGATAVINSAERIKNITYTNGTVNFDYLDDGAGDFGQLMLSNPVASAGRTLKITGAVSPNGDATGWHAALYQVDLQEAFAGPQVTPLTIQANVTSSYTSTDGFLTIKGYSDPSATTLANLGRYQDECFGVYGGTGGNVVDISESLTLHFASGIGLSRLDSIYSAGDVVISGFLSDPGFVDPSFGASSSFYSDGTLTISLANSGLRSFYFSNRAASAGQTLRINVADSTGAQFGISGIGYEKLHTLIGPDVSSDVAVSQTTPDGLLTISGYADTPGVTPAYLHESVNWFGLAGGLNNEAIDGTESMTLQFASTVGLSGLGTRYTSGQVIISGFASDPGFVDPSGTASDISYADGTLKYTFNAPRSPEIMVLFTNVAASMGKTLALNTDGASGSQIALTRINYAERSAEPVKVSISGIDGKVVLSWASGTLLESSSVAGPYTPVSGASSPYTSPASDTQKFYCVKVQ